MSILGLDGIGRTTEPRIRVECWDADRRVLIEVVYLAPAARKPKMVLGDQVYHAAEEQPDGTWIYRAAERA